MVSQSRVSFIKYQLYFFSADGVVVTLFQSSLSIAFDTALLIGVFCPFKLKNLLMQT